MTRGSESRVMRNAVQAGPRGSQALAGEKRITFLKSGIWNLGISMARDLECCREAPSPSKGR